MNWQSINNLDQSFDSVMRQSYEQEQQSYQQPQTDFKFSKLTGKSVQSDLFNEIQLSKVKLPLRLLHFKGSPLEIIQHHRQNNSTLNNQKLLRPIVEQVPEQRGLSLHQRASDLPQQELDDSIFYSRVNKDKIRQQKALSDLIRQKSHREHLTEINDKISFVTQVRQMILNENPMIDKIIEMQQRKRKRNLMQIQSVSNQRSEAYEKFRQHMRESSQPGYQPTQTQFVQDDAKTDDEVEQQKADLTRYISLKNANELQVINIIQIPVMERSQNEQFYLQMYLLTLVPFFSIYDKTTFTNLCWLLTLKKFGNNEVIYRKGEIADSMIIVMSGAVGLYSDSAFTQMIGSRLTETHVFGDKCLKQSDQTERDTYAVSIYENTFCLVLNKSDFISTTFYFEHIQKVKRINYIQSLPFAQSWHIEKMNHFNSELVQVQFIPSELVYEIGSPTEVFYLVISGKLSVEAEVEIEEVNQFPTGLDRWEQVKTKRLIQFKAHEIMPNEVFGLQEIIEQLQKGVLTDKGDEEVFNVVPRKFRVRAITYTSLICLKNTKIKQFFNLQDLIQIQKSQFNYDVNKTQESIKNILNSQKFVNQTICEATVSNIRASTEGTDDFALLKRNQKEIKQSVWLKKALKKSKLIVDPNQHQTDRIKILSTRVEKKSIIKTSDGEFRIRDIQSKNTFTSPLTTGKTSPKANTLPLKPEFRVTSERAKNSIRNKVVTTQYADKDFTELTAQKKDLMKQML